MIAGPTGKVMSQLYRDETDGYASYSGRADSGIRVKSGSFDSQTLVGFEGLEDSADWLTRSQAYTDTPRTATKRLASGLVWLGSVRGWSAQGAPWLRDRLRPFLRH